MLDVLRQLADELKLPPGSENRLRLLGMGNGEINAVIDRAEDAQRVRGILYCGKGGGDGTGRYFEICVASAVAFCFSYCR